MLRQTLRQTLRWRMALALFGVLATWGSLSCGQSWNDPFDGDWDDPDNWSTGAVPDGPTVDVAFRGANGGEPITVTLQSERSVRSLLFEDNLASYTLAAEGGATLTMANGALVNINESREHTVAVPLGGVNGFVKLGAGTLVLKGDHSLSGVTAIGLGRLKLDGTLSASEQIFVQSGATFDLTSQPSYTLAAGQTLDGSGLVAPGVVGLTIVPGSTLAGNLSVQGNVVNRGRIAPAALPADLSIQGLFTQALEGVVEIHAMSPSMFSSLNLPVGSATLGGRLDFYADAGYLPGINDELLVVRGKNLQSRFDSLFAPQFFSATGLAIEVAQDSSRTRLRFVAPRTGVGFVSASSVANWSIATNWTGGSVPAGPDVLVLQNHAGGSQTINLAPGSSSDQENAFVHELTIVGNGGQTMTLAMGTASSLSATRNITIGSGGVLSLKDGNVASGETHVEGGGLLSGRGNIAGALSVGDAAGGAKAALQLGVALGGASPLGELSVEGDYTQSSNGELRLAVSGASDPTSGFLDVSGNVELGGKLVVDVSGYTGPGQQLVQVIGSGGNLSGSQFQAVEASGNAAYYVTPLYHPEETHVVIDKRGDMNLDGTIDMGDVDYFALALVDPEAYYNSPRAGSTVPIERSGDHVGNVDFDNDFDFDDLKTFASILNASPTVILAAMARLTMEVPEPNSLWMASGGSALYAGTRRRKGSSR